MKTDKRRVVRISENGYNLLKEIQKQYEKKIGFSPTLAQLLELSITKLSKQSLLKELDGK